MIRVVVAEDEPLLRSGLAALVTHDGDVDVVAAVGTGNEAVAVTRRLHPDVVLMDVRMPGQDGIAASAEITTDDRLSGVAVLVLTTFGEDETVTAAIRAGAAGYLLKDVSAEDLRDAVRTVASGGSVLHPEVTGGVMRAVARSRADETHLVEDLSPREREVLAAVGDGLSNAEVATRLVVSEHTARTYVSRLMGKLDTHDRAKLVVLANRAGLAGRAEE